MKFRGETVLEMMGAQMLPSETGQAMSQCAVILTEGGLYVAEDAYAGKAVRLAETVPVENILSMERVIPEAGETRFARTKAWVDARRWPRPMKWVARLLFPPVVAFFSFLADHFTRGEEEPGTRFCVRYAAGHNGEAQELSFVRCEGNIDLMQRAWQRQQAKRP